NAGVTRISVSGEAQLITGIDDGIVDEASILMYPNPALNEFTLDVSSFNGLPVDISIITTSGARIYNVTDWKEALHTVNIRNYRQGMFIVLIESKNQIVKKKLIIRR
ncbi:MAG: hypothetical protein ACI82Q_002588, partial [Nonlabens sp.]